MFKNNCFRDFLVLTKNKNFAIFLILTKNKNSTTAWHFIRLLKRVLSFIHPYICTPPENFIFWKWTEQFPSKSLATFLHFSCKVQFKWFNLARIFLTTDFFLQSQIHYPILPYFSPDPMSVDRWVTSHLLVARKSTTRGRWNIEYITA